MTFLEAVVLVAYASLAVELTLLHVPSIASTRTLWSRPSEVEAGYTRPFRRLFLLSRWKKLLLFAPPLLVVYGVYLYPAISLWGPRDPLGDHAFVTSGASDVLAAVLVVAGRSFTLGSAVVIRTRHRRSSGPDVLWTEGPFRLSRNPGLMGMYLFVLGLWLLTPSLTMLGGILVYVLYMHTKVRMEENFLENRFGASYRAYVGRTNRYWP